MTTPTRESQLPGAQPLLRRRLWAFVLEVLDRERVAALKHLDARASLPGDRLPVFAEMQFTETTADPKWR